VSRFFAAFLSLPVLLTSSLAMAQPAALAPVQSLSTAQNTVYDGQIEAMTQTRMAAQVSGLIKQVLVKAGDHVSRGQLLLEIDDSLARQQQAAMQAQVTATRAQLQVLTSELQRQQQLFAQGYISKGALERIEAEQQATQALLNAQQAQAKAAAVQTSFFRITAPYDGILIDVPAEQGDMAMPGMQLLSMFAPAALRVGVSIPVTALSGGLPATGQFLVSDGQQRLVISAVEQLPVADAGSQTRRLRLNLEPGTSMLPGQTVKVALQRSGARQQRLFVPAAAVVRRAELTAVYVQSTTADKALLRQVRLGANEGELVEVLSGLTEGEQVYLDPHTASRE
jgi:RND family efflux transporter MFP subunit